jgi:solute carrier family 25 folate transporter 32
MTGDHNNTPSTSDLEAYASQHRALARAQSDQTGHDASHNLLYRIAIGRSDSSLQGMAGAAAGFASGIVTCPLDVIKTKLQAQGGFRTRNGLANPPVNLVYKGMFGTAKVIWKEEGVRGMYRGLGPIILGYLPTWAVWFVVYGKSKEYFGTTNWKGNAQLTRLGTIINWIRT